MATPMNIDVVPGLTIDSVKRVCCIGSSRSAIVSMFLLARRWPTKQFHIIADDEVHLSFLTFIVENNPAPPIFEPGLFDYIFDLLNANVIFTNDPFEAIHNSQIIFIGSELGRTKGHSKRKASGILDCGDYQDALRLVDIHSNYEHPKYIIELENMPAESIAQSLEYLGHTTLFALIAIPTIFSQGSAVNDFEQQIIHDYSIKHAGGFDVDDIHQLLTLFYSGGPDAFVERVMVRADPADLELAIAFTNVLLASRVCDGNVLSTLAGTYMSNYPMIFGILENDLRLHPPTHMTPGIGFSGVSMERDIQRLMRIAKEKGFIYCSNLMNERFSFNRKREDAVVDFIVSKMRTTSARTILILGVTTKPGTNDITNSRSLSICGKLLKDTGITLRIFDPRVNIDKLLSHESVRSFRARIQARNDIGQLFGASDVVIIMTPWDEVIHFFMGFDVTQPLVNTMRNPNMLINLCPTLDLPYEQLGMLFNEVHVLDRPERH